MAGQWEIEEVTAVNLSATSCAVRNYSFGKPGYEFFGLKAYIDAAAGNYTVQFQWRGDSAQGATGQGLVWTELTDAGGSVILDLNGSGTTDICQLYGTSNVHSPFVVLPEEARLRFTSATPTDTDVTQIIAYLGKPFGG